MECIAFVCLLMGYAIDGDTFWSKNDSGVRNTYRVFGIDTPERGEPGYYQAKDALQALLRQGAACEQAGSDTWGRKVVSCEVAPTTLYGARRDIGCEMIRGGYARIYEKFAGDSLDHCLPQ